MPPLKELHYFDYRVNEPSFGAPLARLFSQCKIPKAHAAGAAVHLARRYHKDLQLLSERFGGYTSFWLYCAERLANEPIDGKIPYPLWNSWLWEEWKKRPPSSTSAYPREGRVQSGALA